MKLTKQEFDPELVAEIESGGNTKPGVPIEVQITRGSQLVSVPMDSPINVFNFEGKTVINYALLFDSGMWGSPFGDKYVINSSNKVTLTADADHQYFTVDVSVKANTDYTLSATHNGKIGTSDGAGGVTLAPFTSSNEVTFNSGVHTDIKVILSNIGLGNGTFTFEDVMLNEGITVQEFVANVKGVVNPTIENTNTGDSLTVVGTFHTGDIVDVESKELTRAKREVVLDGVSIGSNSVALALTGSKRVYLGSIPRELGNSVIVKYNGKLLYSTPYSSSMSIDSFNDDTNELYIVVANTDSGWGDAYTPTVAEIQAYFNGWRMYDGSANRNPYNGTGVKGWFKINKISDFTMNLPTESYMEWNPYRLLYDLTTPITESIETIGSLNLSSGDNTVELTEGIVINERVYPALNSPMGYVIYGEPSNSFWSNKNATSKNSVELFLVLYKNGKQILGTEASVFEDQGNNVINISEESFDPKAIYAISYIPKETYKISAHANPIDITYRDTLGGISEELVKDVSQLDSRLSDQQNEISSIIPIAKASGGDFAKAYGLGTVAHNLGQGYDLNNVTKELASNGTFMGENFINSSFGIGWAFIKNIRHNHLYGKQIAHVFTGENRGKVFERIQEGGNWLPWEEKGGSSGGGGYVKIGEVATTSHQSLVEFNTTGYDKVRLIFKDVSHNAATLLSLVLYINGVAQASAYSGHRMYGNSISGVTAYAMSTTAYNSSKGLYGHVDVDFGGGLVTVEGMTTAILKSNGGIDSTADFHKGMLRRLETSLYSVSVGFTQTAYMYTGLIELWGVPK